MRERHGGGRGRGRWREMWRERERDRENERERERERDRERERERDMDRHANICHKRKNLVLFVPNEEDQKYLDKFMPTGGTAHVSMYNNPHEDCADGELELIELYDSKLHDNFGAYGHKIGHKRPGRDNVRNLRLQATTSTSST